MTFGELLKTKRTMKKLSQTEIAEKLGICKQIVSRWENNLCLPDIMLIPKIGEILNVQPNYIMSVIWKSDSRVELFDIEVSKDFNRKILNYHFTNVRQMGENRYFIKCTYESFEKFVKKFDVEKKITVAGPMFLKRKIILENLVTSCNYSVNEKFEVITKYCFNRYTITMRSVKETVYSSLTLSRLACEKFLLLKEFDDFKSIYNNSNNKDEFVQHHKKICEDVINSFYSVFNENNVSPELFNFDSVRHRISMRIVNFIFNTLIQIKLLDENHESFKYLNSFINVKNEYNDYQLNNNEDNLTKLRKVIHENKSELLIKIKEKREKTNSDK